MHLENLLYFFVTVSAGMDTSSFFPNYFGTKTA